MLHEFLKKDIIVQCYVSIMIVRVSQSVGPDLATRNGCDKLFDSLECSPDMNIILDFSEVSSISRSFAHQYFLRKRSSKKSVSEVNVPAVVRKMMNFVQKGSTRRQMENSKVKSKIIPVFQKP